MWKELDYSLMTESEKQMLVSEVNLLRELKHKHIVRYVDRIINRTKMTLYIVMEYCEGGDLASYITKTKREGYDKKRHSIGENGYYIHVLCFICNILEDYLYRCLTYGNLVVFAYLIHMIYMI